MVFPKPEAPGDVQEHTSLKKRILRELQKLQEVEKLSSLFSPESQRQILGNIDWKVFIYVPNERNRTHRRSLSRIS